MIPNGSFSDPHPRRTRCFVRPIDSLPVGPCYWEACVFSLLPIRSRLLIRLKLLIGCIALLLYSHILTVWVYLVDILAVLVQFYTQTRRMDVCLESSPLVRAPKGSLRDSRYRVPPACILTDELVDSTFLSFRFVDLLDLLGAQRAYLIELLN
jgi:hypothetical protein